MYNRSGLANYAEGGVVPEEIGTDAVGDLFTSIQRPPITRRYFTPPIQQADGTYGNTGYDPSLAPRTIGQDAVLQSYCTSNGDTAAECKCHDMGRLPDMPGDERLSRLNMS